jgi:acyl-CoA thioester hydrolase
MRVPLPPTVQFAIVRFLLEFRAELHWPGNITVGTRLEQVGRSSVTLMQGLFADERCVAIANSVVALMDKTTRRSVTMPDTIAHALSMAFSSSSPPEMAHMNRRHRTSE